MTLTNICILAICLCAVWMLEEAAKADPPTLPLGPLPGDRAQETEYLPTVTRTLLRSSSLGIDPPDAESSLSADVEDATLFDDWEPSAQSREASAGLTSAFSQALTGLLTPVMPGGSAWSQSVGDDTVTERVRVGLPFLYFNAPRETGLIQRMGPLALDLYAISSVALYSDLPHSHTVANNHSGFLAAVSLRGALTLELGESAYLAVGFTVYYLPTVNRVGFYFGNQGQPETAATFRYQTDVGRWLVTVDDRFRVYSPLGDLLSEYDVNEIAVAGRYRFGRPDTLSNRSFLSEDVFFANVVGASASTQLDEDWKLRVHAQRVDVWSGSNFGSFSNAPVIGADLSYTSPDTWFTPWLTYNFFDFPNLNRSVHHLLAGVTLPLTPTFKLYARTGLGIYESDNGASVHQRYLWELGFVHQINENLSHSLFGGYNYFITDYGDDFLGTYWRYTMALRPDGSVWTFSANIQQQEGGQVGFPDSKYLAYGVHATCALTERTCLTVLATEARYMRDTLNSSRQIVGASLSHTFSHTVAGTISCRYSRYGSSSSNGDFAEHLFLLSITKSF